MAIGDYLKSALALLSWNTVLNLSVTVLHCSLDARSTFKADTQDPVKISSVELAS